MAIAGQKVETVLAELLLLNTMTTSKTSSTRSYEVFQALFLVGGGEGKEVRGTKPPNICYHNQLLYLETMHYLCVAIQ